MSLIDNVPKHYDVFYEEYCIILRKFEDGSYIDIPISTFKEKFNGADTYEEYYNHENVTPAYKEIFDEWGDKGYFD